MATLLSRLQADPSWAADVLFATVEVAYRRWRTRRQRGRWTSLHSTREAVTAGFRHALAVIDPHTPEARVDASIQRLIDDFIEQHLSDVRPYTPPRNDRGRKARGRTAVKIVSWRGVRAYMEAHPVRTHATLARIADRKLHRGLTLLRDGATLAEIRRQTGLRGPDLLRGFEFWAALAS